MDLHSTTRVAEWSQDPDEIRREAILFLTQDIGEWAERREDVCSMAGVDSEKVKQIALDVILTKKSPCYTSLIEEIAETC